MYYKRQVVEFLVWMRDQEDNLADKPNLEYSVFSPRSDGLWFVDRNECWAHNCDFEMPLPTNIRLIKTFVKWHNVDVFLPPPCARLAVYVPVPGWSVVWELGYLLLVASAFIPASLHTTAV